MPNAKYVHRSLAAIVAAWGEECDEEIAAQVKHLVDSGAYEWVWDPFVDGVIGLLPLRACTRVNSNTALVVIYGDSEWEADEHGIAKAVEDLFDSDH